MYHDRYGNPLTTSSAAAFKHFNNGFERNLASAGGVTQAFQAAVTADPGFALGHLVIARLRQTQRDQNGALEALERANRTSTGASPREISLISAYNPLIEGRSAQALTAIRAHLNDYPRDALALQTTTTVFGLIGFSGLPGREAEQLALTSALAPHYGDDWWFLSQHAFSQIEVGQLRAATANIERSYELNPKSGQMAHVRSHVFYESGEAAEGYAFLKDWLEGYDREGAMHGHISWHLALWALDRGEYSLMWKIADEAMSPDASSGPPLVIMCDMAALLYRASLQDVAIPEERWRSISEYAAQYFPTPGIAFGDVHAALVHAMAGNREPLQKIITDAKGPAGDVVSELAEAYAAIAAADWPSALSHLVRGMTDHARIGGSKAQRDLLEFTLSNVLLKLGRKEEARTLLALRRPIFSN